MSDPSRVTGPGSPMLESVKIGTESRHDRSVDEIAVGDTKVDHAAVEAVPEVVARPCPDCGNLATGVYCEVCGEEIEPNLPTLKQYFKELFNEFLSFDSKLIRTIPALLFKPGFLTTEYVAGRRKRYLLPSRIYILVAVVVFFSMNAYIHLKLERVIAGSATIFHFHFKHLTIAQSATLLEAIARLSTSIAPYVLLLECSPLFALALKLIYRKSKIVFAEHLIFTFHLFAFALLILTPALLSRIRFMKTGAYVVFAIYAGFAVHRTYRTTGWRLSGKLFGILIAFIGLAIQAAVLTFVLAVWACWIFEVVPHGAWGI